MLDLYIVLRSRIVRSWIEVRKAGRLDAASMNVPAEAAAMACRAAIGRPWFGPKMK